MKVMIVDNYDSFTYNLHHLVAELTGNEPKVIRNDEWDLDRIRDFNPDAIIISPGPGRPDRRVDFGVCGDLLRGWHGPILGVCLGHQGLVQTHGGRIDRAERVMHGRLCRIDHVGRDLFRNLPQGIQVVRYHSLVAQTPLPASLEAQAWTSDGTVMAVRHRSRPHWGFQFHPESICTQYGADLMRNFIDTIPRRGEVPLRPKKVTRRLQIPSRARWDLSAIGPMPDPETFFERAFAHLDRAFWLDSGRNTQGFSYMGGGANTDYAVYRPGCLELHRTTGTTRSRIGLKDWLRQELAQSAGMDPELPFEFQGGLIGYMGYELDLERGTTRSSGNLPQSAWFQPQRFVVFDHAHSRLYLVQPAGDMDHDWTEHMLNCARAGESARPRPKASHRFRLQRDYDQYMADIERCMDHLQQGNSYEICLTNQILTQSLEQGWQTYRRLRRINPAPYSAYLKMDDTEVLCSSPELMLHLDRNGWMTSKPIKGTRARGEDPESDRRAALELATDEKDRAENLMIVDLVRNDLSKVSLPGSVRVSELMQVETYAQVHQLVSTVTGRLKADKDVIDGLQAIFPGGSMVGAPKRRTMNIIEDLEQHPRGIYSGSIGYLSNNGSACFNKVIRTIVSTPERASIGIGGAIVALSDPDSEFRESLLKGKALIEAIAGPGSEVSIEGCPPGFQPTKTQTRITQS